MEFEYDAYKSEINKEKHGLSLEEAKHLWMSLAVELEARTEDEPRFLRIGRIGEKLYSCIYTQRGNKIRLISARRSRIEEEKLYKEKIEEKSNE